MDETVAVREVTTADAAVDARFELTEGGYYALVARAEDGRGNRIESATSFYVLGEGFAAWRGRFLRAHAESMFERHGPGDPHQRSGNA